MSHLPEKVDKHRAVIEVNEEGTYMRVQPYGNCSLFGKIHRSDKMNLGNVAVTANGDLKLNYDLLE